MGSRWQTGKAKQSAANHNTPCQKTKNYRFHNYRNPSHLKGAGRMNKIAGPAVQPLQMRPPKRSTTTWLTGLVLTGCWPRSRSSNLTLVTQLWWDDPGPTLATLATLARQPSASDRGHLNLPRPLLVRRGAVLSLPPGANFVSPRKLLLPEDRPNIA